MKTVNTIPLVLTVNTVQMVTTKILRSRSLTLTFASCVTVKQMVQRMMDCVMREQVRKLVQLLVNVIARLMSVASDVIIVHQVNILLVHFPPYTNNFKAIGTSLLRTLMDANNAPATDWELLTMVEAAMSRLESVSARPMLQE